MISVRQADVGVGDYPLVGRSPRTRSTAVPGRCLCWVAPDLTVQYQSDDLMEWRPSNPDDRIRRILVKVQIPNRIFPRGFGSAETQHLV